MLFIKLSLFPLGVFAFYPFGFEAPAYDPPIINLSYISLQGSYSPQYNITYYRTIPFADSTTGDNRFRAPQPPPAVAGTYNTDQSFPWCPVPDGSGSEDCLYLGIYSRPWASGAKLRPVTVVFHGGSYITGSASFSLPPSGYPTLNVSDQNDFVLVYPNYRLGVLGFLPGQQIQDVVDADLNVGLLDQQAALMWVNQNIEQFGGDPKNVSLFGQSAGGGSVLSQLIANDGNTTPALFQRAMTNSPYWPKTYLYNDTRPQFIYDKLSNLTGCATTDDSLTCLKGLSLRSLIGASNALGSYLTGPNTIWSPVIDGLFLREPLTTAVFNRKFNAGLVVTMFNTHDGDAFVTSSLKSPNATAFNSSEAGFDSWLQAYLPGFNEEQLESVKALYPPSGSTDTSSWNTTFDRVSYIFRDTTFACPAYWVSSAAPITGWLQEYTVSPALHVSILSIPFSSHLC